jgi:hypothetical protein
MSEGYTLEDVLSKENLESLDREQPEISREQRLEQVLNEIVKVINRAYMAQDIVLVEEDLNDLLRVVGVDTFHSAIKIVPNTRI